MKFIIIFFFLILNYLTSVGQEKSASKYVFSVGYGSFDLFREAENWNQRKYSKLGFNYEQSLVGPIFLKLEKNMNRRLGLALALGYERFTYDADFIIYEATLGDHFGYYANPQYIEYGASIVAQKLVHAQNIYSSFSSTIRLNFYFFNKPYFQFYMGIGVGYRLNFVENFSTMHEQYPETIGTERRLIGGYINDSYLFPIGGEATFGFRGYFYKNLGFYSELGLAKSVFQTGLCLRVQ